MSQFPFRTRALRVSAVAVSISVGLAGCATATKAKPEAIDEALLLGEDAVDALEDAGIGQPELIETVDHPCEDEEVTRYRIVARYGLAVEPVESTAIMREIQDLWVEELEYNQIDGEIFWGDSGYAVGRAEDDGVQYSATRQPDRSMIVISVSTECFENPDEDDWFEPAVPAPTE